MRKTGVCVSGTSASITLTTRPHNVFVCGFRNDVSNAGDNEQRTGKNMKGGGQSLIESTIPEFAWRA